MQDQRQNIRSPSSLGDRLSGTARPLAVARFSSTQPDYLRYEREKLAFMDHNPGATPAQYDAAVRAIAERCGI